MTSRSGPRTEPWGSPSTVALVISALSEPGGFLIVCRGPPHLYAHAINHDGRYLLEFRNGSPDQHFQAEGVSVASIADALSQWMRGERTAIGDHEWKLLTI
jgi:hypothetical protein